MIEVEGRGLVARAVEEPAPLNRGLIDTAPGHVAQGVGRALDHDEHAVVALGAHGTHEAAVPEAVVPRVAGSYEGDMNTCVEDESEGDCEESLREKIKTRILL